MLFNIYEMNEITLQDHENRITRLEQRQDKVDALVEAMASMKTEQANIKEDVSEIKSDIKALVSKDSKTWNELKGKVLWLIVGGLIAYLFYTLLGISL